MGRVGQGRVAEELELAITGKPENVKAGIALAIMYIDRGEAKKALRVTQAMHEHAPENLTLLNLLGTAQVAAKQNDLARRSFEKAISLDPNFITAYLNLSKLDTAERKPAEARQRLQKLHERFPESSAILIELARTDQANGDYEQAGFWLEQARKIDSRSMATILALVDLKLKTGRFSEAVNVALEGKKIDRDNIQLLDALGRSYIAAGNRGKARGVFQKMSDLAGFNAKQLYRIAEQQTAVADYAEAIKTLKKAVVGNEFYIPAQIALAEMELKHGKPIFALNRAQYLVKQYPRQAFGYRLLGDIDSQEGHFAQAVKNYQLAFDREQNPKLVMKLYAALKQAGEGAKAFALLERWVKANPQDNAPLEALAEEHLQAGRLPEAQNYYEILVGRDKNQPYLLNNLAYIYFNSGDERALKYAEQARQLAPEQPSINDTLGWILVNNGQPEQGLHYLRSAYARSSQDPEIHYHIAVALYRLGRLEEAKQELQQALSAKRPFNGIDEARSLLKQISE